MLKRLFGKEDLPPHAEFITIVSGLPRSGTSMMMKMLTQGGIPALVDHIRKADRDNPGGYFEFERVKKLREGDTAWLPEARGKVVKVIATLLPHLPQTYPYRILFMQRSMPEVLASQRKMLIRRGEDPDRIPDEQMAALFEKHLVEVRSWMGAQTDLRTIDVNYNQLVQEPLEWIPRINEFLGGGLEEDRMAAVVNPDLYRQRIPSE